MRQILEGLASVRTKITNLLHYEATNSFNKTEFHFHGPVNFIGKQPKKIKDKAGSSSNGEGEKQIIAQLGERM